MKTSEKDNESLHTTNLQLMEILKKRSKYVEEGTWKLSDAVNEMYLGTSLQVYKVIMV